MGRRRIITNENIKRALDSGARNRREVAEMLNVHYSSLGRVMRGSKIAIEIPKTKRSSPPQITSQTINEALSNGTTTRRQIAKRLGIRCSSLIRKIKEFDMDIPYDIATQIRVPKRDKLKWRHYRESHLQRFQKRKGIIKQEEQQRKQAIGDLVLIAQESALQSLGEDEWAARKALEYKSTRLGSGTPYNLGDLFTIFKRYEEAQKQGIKLSLEELGEGLDMSIMGIRHVLHTFGLEPMYGTKDRHITPEQKKEAIRRAVSIKMTQPDIAYFLGLSDHVINQNLISWGLREKRPKITRPIKQFGIRKDDKTFIKTLNYRLASKIYKAQDLGFTRNEIMELLDTDSRVVDYAFEHKDEIAPKIVDALRTLYPNRRITKPHKDFKD